MEEALKTDDRDETEDLWNRYKADKSIEIRNEIVLAYTWLVRKIVLRFKGSYSNFGQLDDMVNQGVIALIDSVERFDPDMGNKFESFASVKIKGSIIDFMRKQDWVPRNQRNLAKELEEIYGQLYAQTGREPTREEIAEKMEISLLHLDKILQQRHNAFILSYEEVINEKLAVVAPLIDNARDMSSPEPEVLYSELKEVLVGAIDALNEKERLVITLYYYESLKLREIAEILGITESRVSQIHSASIIKMKHRMNKY
ncbi:MAG: FliA/WhiG family RNA polymerase sigma factor [Anaerovoracaceae bacterium]